MIPYKKKFDMTDLINVCLKQKYDVSIFPLHEYWTDIGTLNDLQKARTDFNFTEQT